MIGLGMEGQQFKMVFYIKEVEIDTWLDAIYEILKGLAVGKRKKAKSAHINELGNTSPYKEKVFLYV